MHTPVHSESWVEVPTAIGALLSEMWIKKSCETSKWKLKNKNIAIANSLCEGKENKWMKEK